jgi:hypothetical protein
MVHDIAHATGGASSVRAVTAREQALLDPLQSIRDDLRAARGFKRRKGGKRVSVTRPKSFYSICVADYGIPITLGCPLQEDSTGIRGTEYQSPNGFRRGRLQYDVQVCHGDDQDRCRNPGGVDLSSWSTRGPRGP